MHALADTLLSGASPLPQGITEIPEIGLLCGERRVAVHQVAVVGNARRQQVGQAFHVVAPVNLQLAGDGEPVHQLRAGSGHTGPGSLLHGFIEGAGSIGDHKPNVPTPSNVGGGLLPIAVCQPMHA